MRRVFSILALALGLCCGIKSYAQSDAMLLELPVQEDSVNGSDPHKFYHLVRNQLRGRCRYYPECVEFFRLAWHELGPFESVLATADRLTRCSQIGTLYYPNALKTRDGLIPEGVEAYKSGWTRPVTAASIPVATTVLGTRFITDDVSFVEYLLAQERSADAALYLDHTPFHPSDTLSFLKALSSYDMRDFASAAGEFSRIGSDSAYAGESALLGAVSYAGFGDYDSALKSAASYTGPDTELKGFTLASLYLLDGDKTGYEIQRNAFTYSDFTLLEGERTLDKVYSERYETKRKSPLLAAAASALFPGLGKAYAGRLDEGVAAFMTVGVLGAFTANCWIKDGLSDWKTIAFGSLASLFYLGNIYGSYFSVGIYNNMLSNAQNATILFNLHIPVRQHSVSR